MSNEKEQHTVTVDMSFNVEWSETAIVMSDFAKDWFEDARNEATRETDNDIAAAAARRREIIFAVCALESYLFEWVRDILLLQAPPVDLLAALYKYFPQRQKKPITEKWKDIPKMLCDDKLIKKVPDLSGQTWKMFKEDLYECRRNNLIHAGASRPKKEVKPYLDPPAPSTNWKAELGRFPAGWAVGIVTTLIEDLNDKAGTHAPSWLNPEQLRHHHGLGLDIMALPVTALQPAENLEHDFGH